MFYSVKIPAQCSPAADSFLDRDHFVQCMFERSGAQYFVINQEEFLQRHMNEEEAREHSPEVMEFFDAGISKVLEFTLSGDGQPYYEPLSQAPSRDEVAQMILAEDLHGAHVLNEEEARNFVKNYRGHQWIQATNALRQELERAAW